VAETNSAHELHDTFPGTWSPLRLLVDATAAFRSEQVEKNLRAFDAAFAETVRALAKDAPAQSVEEHRQSLLKLLASFREACPDRQDQCRFLERILNEEQAFAESKIQAALLVPAAGIEPATFGLQNRCSTN
jgi:hypothetical protein